MKMKNLSPVLMLLISLQTVAAVRESAPEGTRTQASSQVSTTTQALQQQAAQWGVTEEDYRRYRALMEGPRGMQSPGLDPLTVLGIEARTDAERRQLAEKWVKAEYERTEKELAFQREVNAAWKRLYPGVMPVSLGKGGGLLNDNGGRLALFVKAKDCGTCDARLASVLSSGRQVNIYLVDSQGSDNLLRQWALEHDIPVDRVRSRHITLNHDAGRWLRFGEGRMPVVLQQGADGWRVAAF
ncbi:TIGR03759 family integrating conjugative element protein [Escherichia coli]